MIERSYRLAVGGTDGADSGTVAGVGVEAVVNGSACVGGGTRWDV